MIPSKRIGQFLGSAATAFLCAGMVGAQQPRPHALPTTREIPNAFGTSSYTVTTVPAVAFFPETNYETHYFTSGSLGRYPDEGLSNFYAGIDLPPGVVIDFIGLNSMTTIPFVAGAELVRRNRFGNLSVIGSIDSTIHGWDTDFNVGPIGYTWHGRSGEALILHVQFADHEVQQFFGWVEVWWKRSVSPAPAFATFNDVPTNHPFFQFIQALAASGITSGCGGENYCPDAAVTRGQMAVFLAKALGLHWPGV